MPTNNTPAFISQNESGFPAYLDFNSMRSEAIGYLGPITSAYWTDYNEHDPGITTLEALLYALVDLGYRVNWPIQDLLTQKSGMAETDFLTPAQVLGSNPCTINDYRKLLMDLAEVRNAWLRESADSTSINGIYEVLLELEEDVTGFATGEEWVRYRDGVVAEVRRVLQAHRNLCEDFREPVVMGKQPYAVTADIELAAGASIPQVYQALIRGLYQFFSPTATYYTLPQLIAMGVSLDEVFAGRPFGKRPSHGFVLDSDLPALPGGGTQAIYSSDVYNILLQTPGVAAVKNLNVGSTGAGVWIVSLDQNVLPVLSVSGSGFRWFLDGQQLSWTPGTAPEQLQKMLAYSGKVLLAAGAPLLDNGVPSGTYLDGLGTYYSIQKDFPEVYGIGPGGLPASASPQRQAQAWQFKGYLLFFEQLMADFLAQLANIRSLLSMSGQGAAAAAAAATDEDDDPEDRTGWGADIDPAGPDTGGAGGLYAPTPGDLSDVPGLGMLLQFPPGAPGGGEPGSGAGSGSGLGSGGGMEPGGGAAPGGGTNTGNVMLAFPVDAHHWHELVRRGSVTCEEADRMKPYLFATSHDRDLAVAELLLSFAVMPPTPGAVVLEGGKKQVFVISGIRHDFVLLSKSIYDIGEDVVAAGRTAIFAGTSKNFYFPSVLTESGKVGYSFSVGQSDLSYTNYVSQLLSNPRQSVQQRTGYLLHLIDRFAEAYSDYAKLSAGFLSAQAIFDRQVGLMQRFLTNLPMLGADRCKAYNYTRGSWDTINESGLELRFKAYCGIADWRRHYLCHFEVTPAEKQYRLQASLGDSAIMSSTGNFTEAEGYDAAGDLYHRMRSAANYRLVKAGVQPQYRFVIDLASGERVTSVMSWPDETAAADAVKQLEGMFQSTPRAGDIFPDKVDYVAEIVNAEGLVVRVGRQAYPDEDAAYADAGKKVHDIGEDRYWQMPAGMERVPGRLERNREEGSHLYMDTHGLEMAVKHDIPHKPEHCRYVVADEGGEFIFSGTEHYPTATAGRAASRVLLFLLLNERNYAVEFDAAAGRYRVVVLAGGRVEATEAAWLASEQEALHRRDRIIGLLQARSYTLRMAYSARSWKFRFPLGLPGMRSYIFESSRAYPTEEEALAAAGEFYRADTGWELNMGREVILEKSGGGGGSVSCVLQGPASADQNELQQLVVAKSTVLALEQGNRETMSSWLVAGERSREGGYVYRLVDKDRPRAFHVLARGAQGDAEGRGEAQPSGDAGARGDAQPSGDAGARGDAQASGDAGARGDAQPSGDAGARREAQASGDAGLRAAEAAREELVRRGRQGYRYPEFCLGGDNVIARIDESGAVVYHYCIRCRNDYFYRLGLAGEEKEWVLFESIAGYPTEDAAQQAFQDNYLLILEKAMERVNFGEKDLIAWDEHGRRKAGVYVNEELRRALEHAGLNVAEELVKAARAYPIRRVINGKRQPRYYFQLGESDWISAGRFASAQDAHTAFNYFRLLLAKGSNYFIEYDDAACGYRVGIREVLAESSGAYASEEEAWGKDGVQRFIGAAQTPGGWHPEKREECYWGYFAACPNDKAVHPCTYESGRQRDEALERLYAAAQGFPEGGWKIEATETGLNQALDTWDPYFPVVRTKRIGAAAEYRVEIRLPGFAALPGAPFTDKACGCPPEEHGSEPTCYAAWISHQVYPSAVEAWNAYQALLPLLADKNNYRPVHDEDALSYGIELLEEDSILARSIQPYFYAKMAARALDRAKDCVNMEGLNVVEHVLLRNAGTAIPTCAAGDNPAVGSIRPGADAYSFVMTVFLPAWPQRFRKKENRQLLESIVQRETPAHILPRILWLTPGDMCRMEASYKKWLHWLHTDKRCGDFQPGELIRLLFSTPTDCMWDIVCGQGEKQEKGDEWLSEINKLYCWSDSQCADTGGWARGTGSTGNKDKKPFVMSGTRLQRPGLVKTIAENKPEKVRQAPKAYRRGHVIDDTADNGKQIPRRWLLWFMLFIRRIMKDGGRVIRRIGIRRKP